MFDAPCFPGHYCPGLIEARAAIAAPPRTLPSFRGITAPASLKPQRHQGGRRIGAHFPGHYCPGLIEAKNYIEAEAIREDLSGALLPRPH